MSFLKSQWHSLVPLVVLSSRLSVLNSVVLFTSQYFLADIPFKRGKDKEDAVHTHTHTHTHAHTMKYYSAVKKDETMPLTTTWMDLEIIRLN